MLRQSVSLRLDPAELPQPAYTLCLIQHSSKLHIPPEQGLGRGDVEGQSSCKAWVSEKVPRKSVGCREKCPAPMTLSSAIEVPLSSALVKKASRKELPCPVERRSDVLPAGV